MKKLIYLLVLPPFFLQAQVEHKQMLSIMARICEDCAVVSEAVLGMQHKYCGRPQTVEYIREIQDGYMYRHLLSLKGYDSISYERMILALEASVNCTDDKLWLEEGSANYEKLLFDYLSLNNNRG